ncbi:MAG TPA: ABC transporter permease [Gemmatimonadaceae bacterium]|nr:ABC transporter permease [Gemmatimonadaceae bacterium]
MRAIFARGAMERELDDELRFHLEMDVAARVRAGQSPEAARTEAFRAFGGVERFKEDCRDARGVAWLEAIGGDTRRALRSMASRPAFTLAVVLTLGLGIGANTAIFSVVNAVLLQPLPYDDAGRLVMLWENDRNSGTVREPASVPDFFDFVARNRVFSGIVGLQPRALNFTAPSPGADAELLSAAAVTRDFLRTIGVSPLLGRDFTTSESAPGGPPVVLISEHLWRTRFAASPSVIGQRIELEDSSYTVVGVLPNGLDLPSMPPGFTSLSSGLDLWLPLAATPASSERSRHDVVLVARLRPGVTVAVAQREMAALASQLEAEYPGDNRARGVFVEPLQTSLVRNVRPALAVLFAAVGLVLLIACANVANLLLARTVARRREVAVRLALGAGASRIAVQFFVESILLALTAAAVGVGIAVLGLRALLSLAPADLPRIANISLDPRVLGFTLAIALVLAIAFGLLPALVARGMDVQSALREEGGRGSSGTRARARLRGALVVLEVALSVMLVIGAALMIRSVWSLRNVNPGFEPERLLEARYQLPPSRYPQDFSSFPRWSAISGFHSRLIEAVEAIPGVKSASVSASDPLQTGYTNSFVIVGREAEAEHQPEIYVRSASPSYFATAGIRLLRGRLLSDGDDAEAPPVLLINEAGAKRFFPDSDPVGQHISFWGASREIVGVVADEKFAGLASDTPPAVYPPIWQVPRPDVSLLVRTTGDPAAAARAVRREVRALDPEIALYDVRTMGEALTSSIGKERFTMLLLGSFAALALVLAVIGVHGVLSYAVEQRRHEMGIRMALGAQRSAVLGMVVRQGMTLSIAGIVLGVLGALAVTRLLGALLFGVGPTDAATYSLVVGVIALAAAVASFLPARAATSIDPATSLRAQ